MATSKISKIEHPNEFENPTARFSIKSSGTPTSNTYPRAEIRRSGPSGGYALSAVYNANSSSTVMQSIVDMNGKFGVGSITVKSVSVSIPVNSVNVSITAPSVSGFTFLCWLGVSSSGSIKLGYIENMLARTTKVWVESSSSSAITFVGYALYRTGLNAGT